MLAHFVGCYSMAAPLPPETLTNAPAARSWRRSVSVDGRLVIWASRMQADANGLLAVAGQLVVDGVPAGSDGELLCWRELAHQAGNESALNEAQGSFALISYDDAGLCLATDSLGARPLYYAVHAERIWFATAFALLRDVLPVQGEPDWQALAEKIAFFYPLGRRTMSTAISLLADGEMLNANAGGWRLQRYHDWRAAPVRPRDRARELQDCAAAFKAALRARIQPGSRQRALLSGGLDSRLIVSVLRTEGQAVLARNCSASGTLEQLYCRQFAELAGVEVEHREWTLDMLQLNAGQTTSTMLRRVLAGWAEEPVFSGDGGGELFGFITFPAACLAPAGEKGLEALLVSLAGKRHISRQIVCDEFADRLETLALAGLRAEFAPLSGLHPHKAMQLFVLLNDLRSHLHEYFNSLSNDARELLLPFYDRRVIAAALALAPPFDDYVRHRFYYELLPHVSLLANAIPWQSYPDSLPCPLAGDERGETHWQLVHRIGHRHGAHWRRTAWAALRRREQPAVFRRGRILGALLLDMLPGCDYDYLLKQYLALAGDLAVAQGGVPK